MNGIVGAANKIGKLNKSIIDIKSYIIVIYKI